jgi:hypothetical protein
MLARLRRWLNSEICEQCLGFAWAQRACGHFGEDLFAGERLRWLGRGAQTQLLEQFREPRPRGGIGDAEVLLDLSQVSAGGQEYPQQLRVLVIQGTKLAGRENSRQLSAAGAAAEPGDG